MVQVLVNKLLYAWVYDISDNSKQTLKLINSTCLVFRGCFCVPLELEFASSDVSSSSIAFSVYY